MNYNPFFISNQYDNKKFQSTSPYLKNSNQNNINQSNGIAYQNRDVSPNINKTNIASGKSDLVNHINQSPSQNYNNGYQLPQQEGNTFQNVYTAREQNSPISNNNAYPQNSIKMQATTIPNTIQNGITSSQQNIYQQSTPLRQNQPVPLPNYQNIFPISQNYNSQFQTNREKSPLGMNYMNNGSNYNLNQANSLNQNITNINNLHLTKEQPNKDGLSPAINQSLQQKNLNFNITNYNTTNKQIENSQIQYQQDDKNRIYQSPQFGNICNSPSGQMINSNLYPNEHPQSGMITTQYQHQFGQNSQQIQSQQQQSLTPTKVSHQYQSTTPKAKEITINSSTKSIRNLKDQIKQIGNAVSTTYKYNNTNSPSPFSRGEESKQQQQISSSSQNLLSQRPISPQVLTKIENIKTEQDQNQKLSSDNSISPANKYFNTQNQFQRSNTTNYNLSHQNINPSYTNNFSSSRNATQPAESYQNKTNELKTKKENGFQIFQSDKKYQFSQVNNVTGFNKSASNSRNISPQSGQMNLNSANVSNSHTPRSQSKSNSQTALSGGFTQQLFSKKLQEQRSTNQSKPNQTQLIVSPKQNYLNSSRQTQYSAQTTHSTSPQTRSAQINLSSTQNLASSQSKNSEQKTPVATYQQNFIKQEMSNQTVSAATNIQNYIPQISNHSQMQQTPFDTNLNKIQQTPSQSNLDKAKNELSQINSSPQTNSSTSLQNQNWQQWWTEKRNVNIQFIESAKLNKQSECISYLDKNRGELKADILFKDENQNTALHYASQNGNPTLVNFLLYNQANMDSQNKYLITPLMLACSEGHEDVCQILITAGADINFCDYQDNTALHYASKNGHSKVVEILLRKPSLYYKKKNTNNLEALQLASTEPVKKAFEDFFNLQKQLSQSYQKLQIYEVKPQNVIEMFSNIPNTSNFSTNLMNNNIKENNQNNINHNNSNNNLSQDINTSSNTIHNTSSHKINNSKGDSNNNVIKTNESAQIQTENKSNVVQSLNSQLIANTSINLNTQPAQKKKGQENDNKSSINEKNSTSDESKSSFNDKEEKVGPNDFIVHGLIGKGSFGEVYLVQKKGSQIFYAMKVLHKSKIARNNLTKYAMTERNVMSLTKHPFVVRLNYAFQTSDKLFLIMDYCPGGDLGEHLQKEKKFPEDLVRIYLAETVLALEDLHKRDVIFRDLKPDNIVLDQEGHVKLTDFGLSKEGVFDHSSGARSFCGSVAYLAPEMLRRCGHGKAVDWYLLGVVMYELLVGIPPYYANNRDELFNNIEKAALKIPSYLTNEARSLLKSLLQRNPSKRLGSGKGDAEEIKAHPFFNNIDWNSVYQRKLKPPRPNRKFRINTKIDPNLFAETDYKGEKDYIPGWSFVSP